jgi:catechol 2,3-dioxygenase-like lactoylglutathione lyase family enzyme
VKPIKGTLETVLYAPDPRAAAEFYNRVLGFPIASEPGPLSAGLRVGPNQVLLIFNAERSSPPRRDVPSHGTTGAGHTAFLIDPPDYDDWLEHLKNAGVEIEQQHTWRHAQRSIYFRDPAGNSLELITGDIWTTD